MAGLRPDDVVVTFNGVTVMDENHLINLVSLADIGSSVRIEVFRGRQQQLVSLQLTDRDDYRAAEETKPNVRAR